MLKGHMDQTCANNQSTKPPTYTATATAPPTQGPLPEPTIDPEVSAVQESHYTPDTFRLPGRNLNYYFPPSMIPRVKCSLIKLTVYLLPQHPAITTCWCCIITTETKFTMIPCPPGMLSPYLPPTIEPLKA